MELKPPGEYAIPGLDIHNGDIITILDGGTYNTLPQDKSREVLTFKVMLTNGTEKLQSMNNTSQKSLMAAWGTNSDAWLEKKVKVEIVRQRVFDKDKDVVYLTPAEETTPAVPIEEVPAE